MAGKKGTRQVKIKPRGGEEIKAALIAAADLLFGQKGPDAVSVRDIAAQADLIPALIHRYFGSKDELIREVLRGHAAIFRSANTNEAPRAVASSMLRVLSENPAFLNILAHLLLEGHQPEEYLTKEGGIANLVRSFERDGGDGGDEVKLEAALVVAQMAGWLLFEPYLLYAADYRESPEKARAVAFERFVQSIPEQAKKRRKAVAKESRA